MKEINVKPKVHLFVCVNDRTEREGNDMPSCGPKMKPEHVKEIKQWILQKGLKGIVFCTKVSCLGFCHAEGGVACIYPSGRFFKEIQDVDDLKKILMDEIGRLD